MFRFSIREMMLVMLVVCLGLGWGVDHARLFRQGETWRHCAGALEYVFTELHYTVEWTEDRKFVTVKRRTYNDMYENYEDMTDRHEPGNRFYSRPLSLDLASKALVESPPNPSAPASNPPKP